MNNLNPCNICPRKCNKNRNKNIGYCRIKDKIKVARCDLYFYEEPSISGKKGSGTVFFSGCNLDCVYCQNYEISHNNKGVYITIKRLSEIFLELKEKGANNINLVTPTIYIPLIKKALIKAKEKGLNIPIVYNSSGYEDVTSLKLLEGLIDVYMPDFKYMNDEYGEKYSKCKNYSEIAKKAIQEMYRQVGINKFKNNIMTKGVLVRHLILPSLTNDSKEILKYLHDTYQNNIYISIMNQYTPLKTVEHIEKLNKKVTKEEYEEVIEYAIDIGIENAYIQEDETAKESFIPIWDNKGVKKKEN